DRLPGSRVGIDDEDAEGVARLPPEGEKAAAVRVPERHAQLETLELDRSGFAWSYRDDLHDGRLGLLSRNQDPIGPGGQVAEAAIAELDWRRPVHLPQEQSAPRPGRFAAFQQKEGFPVRGKVQGVREVEPGKLGLDLLPRSGAQNAVSLLFARQEGSPLAG